MRIAWFRETSLHEAAPLDETSYVVSELGYTHEIELFTERNAHDFVRKQFRHPYDLCVYELPRTPRHTFVNAYAAHYPGLALSRDALPLGIDQTWSRDVPQTDPSGLLRVGAIATKRPRPVIEAAERARAAGARFELQCGAADEVIPISDVIVALAWPSDGDSLMPAVAAMAAARPVVVFEIEGTAGWPALDPQTWRPRDPLPGDDPIVVSIDPRDEEHSLMLAMRRLSTDAALRRSLATAARAWWASHATRQRALEAWTQLIAAAAAHPPDAVPSAADGTRHARAVLQEFDVHVDFLQ